VAMQVPLRACRVPLATLHHVTGGQVLKKGMRAPRRPKAPEKWQWVSASSSVSSQVMLDTGRSEMCPSWRVQVGDGTLPNQWQSTLHLPPHLLDPPQAPAAFGALALSPTFCLLALSLPSFQLAWLKWAGAVLCTGCRLTPAARAMPAAPLPSNPSQWHCEGVLPSDA
jgi:hypothetical protein